jgi:hypothetical protein
LFDLQGEQRPMKLELEEHRMSELHKFEMLSDMEEQRGIDKESQPSNYGVRVLRTVWK